MPSTTALAFHRHQTSTLPSIRLFIESGKAAARSAEAFNGTLLEDRRAPGEHFGGVADVLWGGGCGSWTTVVGKPILLAYL